MHSTNGYKNRWNTSITLREIKLIKKKNYSKLNSYWLRLPYNFALFNKIIFFVVKSLIYQKRFFCGKNLKWTNLGKKKLPFPTLSYLCIGDPRRLITNIYKPHSTLSCLKWSNFFIFACKDTTRITSGMAVI